MNQRHDATATYELEPHGPPLRGAACLVVLQGPQAGQRIRPGPAPLVIGRADGDLTYPDDRSMSRRHASLETEADTIVVRDLGSTNRTFVNWQPIDGPRTLQRGDVVQIGQLLLKFLFETDPEARCHERLYARSTTDALTGATNRQGFDEALRIETARARRYGGPLSLLLFDVDHFKRFNDTWGHRAGDAVLSGLARLVQSRLRTGDTFARYGGEEFALILLADHAAACDYAEMLRHRIEAAELRHGDPPVRLKVTVSIGVATFGPPTPDEATLVESADRRLYDAKRAGRNRVCGAPATG